MHTKVWEIEDQYGVSHEFHVMNGIVILVGSEEHNHYKGSHIEDVILD